MQSNQKISALFILLSLCIDISPMQGQTISPPAIDTPLTTSKTYFYNGAITVPYSNGQVSITGNAEVQILSTTEVTLLPGFTASVDEGCGEFVGGIQACPPVTITNEINHVSCHDGSDGQVVIHIAGGYPPYQYFWSDRKTENIRKQLKSGLYQVEILDSSGCIYRDSIIINQPDPLSAALTTSPSDCGDSTGTAEAIVSGGSGEYSYYWSPIASLENFVEHLCSGEYSLTVIDTNHCVAIESFEISDANGPEFTVEVVNNASCSGWSDGTALVSINSGIAPFTYKWTQSLDTASLAIGLRSGHNTVMVTDAEGCRRFVSFEISEPDPINLSVSVIKPDCHQSNGTAIATATGGSGIYHYTWSNGSQDSIVNNITSGIDTVIVTDSKGCYSSMIVEVESIGGPEIATNVLAHLSCFDSNDGKASVNVLNGIPPYTYLWSFDGNSGSTVNDLPAGEFTVFVTDSNGCRTKANIVINDPPEIIASIIYLPPSSDSTLDGQAQVVVEGGIPPYSYLWPSSGETSSFLENIGTGDDSVYVTDYSGCRVKAQQTIQASLPFCYRRPSTPACSPIQVQPCGSFTCYKDIVADFGADPTGTVNSQCAFEAASDFFNSRQGNGTLNIPAGNYIVGKQTPLLPPYTNQSPFWKTGNDVLCFVNCQNLIVQGVASTSGLLSKIKFEDCLMYGMFNPLTGERFIADTAMGPMGCGLDPINLNYRKIANPGNFLVLTECTNVIVKYLEVDGNSDHLSYGGHYCDGIEVPASGIILNGSKNVSVNQVKMHHFGLDGVQIHDKNHSPAEPVTQLNITLANSSFDWNGRVGMHWSSGKKVSVFSCDFNYNAMARFGSKAADGVDFEYEGGASMERGNFTKCNFLYNKYAGIECQAVQANFCRDITFISCNFACGESIDGNSFAAIPGGRNFDFIQCNFYGSVIGAFHARACNTCITNDNTKFRGLSTNPSAIGCSFNEEYRSYSMNADLNDECTTGLTNTPHLWLVNFASAARALFENCTFTTNRQLKLLNLVGGTVFAPANNIILRNSNLYNYGLTGSNDLGSVYAVTIDNSSVFIPIGSNYSFTASLFVVGAFQKFATLLPPVPFCKPKYPFLPYGDRVLDAFNCGSCVTILPAFCPEDTAHGCSPCPSRISKFEIVENTNDQLIIQPNPSSASILISNLEPGSILKIYSTLGDCIFTTFSETEELDVYIRELKNGIYLIDNGPERRSKFIKTD